MFANGDELSKLLEDKNVVIEAEPINQSRGFLASLILGFGPVILLIGLFVYFARRAGGGGGDERARRVRPLQGAPRRGRRAEDHVRRRGRHRRGQGGADRRSSTS